MQEENQKQGLSKNLSQNLNQNEKPQKERQGVFSQIWNKLTSGYKKRKKQKEERERLVEELELNSLSSLTHTRIKQLAKKYPKAAEELARRREEKLKKEVEAEAFSHTFEYHKLKKLEDEVNPKPMGDGKVAQFYKWLDHQDKKRQKFYKWLDEKQKQGEVKK